MVSPIFFLLFATAFAAGVPNIKRDPNALFTVISGGLSAVNTSVTVASGTVAQLSSQDPNNVQIFTDAFNNITHIINQVVPDMQKAVLNQASLDDTQAQQLGNQVTGFTDNLSNLAQSILEEQKVIDNSNQTCFVQVTANLIGEAMLDLISPVVIVSPRPRGVTIDFWVALLSLSELPNLIGQSSCG